MRLQLNPEKCTGCQLCELSCSFGKEKAVWPAKSRVTVLKWRNEHVFVPFVCQQCEKPLCQEACPVGAISRKAETGALVVDGERCVGCKMCVIACPFGGVAFDPDRGQAVKCDLCGGDPECVRFCPTAALTFIREEQHTQAKRREAARKLAAYLDVVGR